MKQTYELRDLVVNNLSVKDFEGIVKDMGFKLDNIAGVKRSYPCRVQDAINHIRSRKGDIETPIMNAIAKKAKA